MNWNLITALLERLFTTGDPRWIENLHQLGLSDHAIERAIIAGYMQMEADGDVSMRVCEILRKFRRDFPDDARELEGYLDRRGR